MKDEDYKIEGFGNALIRDEPVLLKTGFDVYAFGGRIGRSENIQEARVLLFKYVKNCVAERVKSYQKKIEEANTVLSILGEDEFNLGTFKQH